MTKTLVQANEITYELHSLGWKSFQDLCITIISQVFGQTVQSFCPYKDAGRDGAFCGNWKDKDGTLFEGSFTIQCKFTSKPGNVLHFSDIKDELAKATALAKKKIAENYFLMTNFKITAPTENEIKCAFEAIPEIKKIVIFGEETISRYIRESSRLRSLVPRIYGLGDLSQIIDERAYNQAKQILTICQEDLKKFVITDAYRNSEKAIHENGFVLLLGEPASGKSTIASALAIGSLDLGYNHILKIRDASEFVKHWNTNEKQFIWVDDVFGTTQLNTIISDEWNRSWIHLQSAIKKGTRVLFTSRDYIYNSAKEYLKISDFPLLNHSQVIIYVEKLTQEEKNQILYNHIKLGNQPSSFKNYIKHFLPNIARKDRFLPETARRLGNDIFTKNLDLLTPSSLNGFIEKPLEFLCDTIKSMDDNHKAALALIFMRGGYLKSPIKLDKKEKKSIALLNSNLALVFKALNSLNDSLVHLVLQESIWYWKFKHPTIGDAYASLIANDRELEDIYLKNAPIETLLQEVICGSISLSGAKIVVSEENFCIVIRRLEEIDIIKNVQNNIFRDRIHFLANRCDKKFLEGFLKSYPNFIDKLSIYSNLKNCIEIHLIYRLYKFGILPENYRISYVEKIKKLNIQDLDSNFISDDAIRSLINDDEFEDILLSIKQETFPYLDQIIEEIKTDLNKDPDSLESTLKDLIRHLETFEVEFSHDSESLDYINSAINRCEKIMENLNDNYSQYQGTTYVKNLLDLKKTEERSIFDDVDS